MKEFYLAIAPELAYFFKNISSYKLHPNLTMQLLRKHINDFDNGFNLCGRVKPGSNCFFALS